MKKLVFLISFFAVCLLQTAQCQTRAAIGTVTRNYQDTGRVSASDTLDLYSPNLGYPHEVDVYITPTNVSGGTNATIQVEKRPFDDGSPAITKYAIIDTFTLTGAGITTNKHYHLDGGRIRYRIKTLATTQVNFWDIYSQTAIRRPN